MADPLDNAPSIAVSSRPLPSEDAAGGYRDDRVEDEVMSGGQQDKWNRGPPPGGRSGTAQVSWFVTITFSFHKRDVLGSRVFHAESIVDEFFMRCAGCAVCGVGVVNDSSTVCPTISRAQSFVHLSRMCRSPVTPSL